MIHLYTILSVVRVCVCVLGDTHDPNEKSVRPIK